jgi:hypothetical protein
MPVMIKGWNIVTRRPDPNGGADLQGCFLVAVADKTVALALVQSELPDAQVWADSEASDESLETYAVNPGQVVALVEGK